MCRERVGQIYLINLKKRRGIVHRNVKIGGVAANLFEGVFYKAAYLTPKIISFKG